MKFLSLTWLLLLSITSAMSQTRTGIVTDSEKNPLPGVSIQVEGSATGTITDSDGKFSIPAEFGETLIFSHIGMEQKRIVLGDQTQLAIEMEGDAEMLGDVIITGYSTQRSKDLTSSISTVRAEVLEKTPAASPLQALQGKVAGVQLVSDGSPGGVPVIRVRGIGSFTENAQAPLYVVDGMFFDNIDFLNSGDIENVTILKDASAAAIYGVKAANGVIIITTKSGGFERKGQVTYDGYVGLQFPTHALQMANAEEYSRWALEARTKADSGYVSESMQRYGRSRINPNVPSTNTNWFNLLVEPAQIQSHSLNFSGGSKNAAHSVAASYFSQAGMLKSKNDYERFNLRANADFKPKKWLQTGGNIVLSNTTRHNPGNIWLGIYRAVPILPVYDDANEDPKLNPIGFASAQDLGYKEDMRNPAADAEYQNDRTLTNKILYNVYAEGLFLRNRLRLKTAFNQEIAFVQNRAVTPQYRVSADQQNAKSSISKSMDYYNNYIWDNSIHYNHDFGKHKVALLGGMSFRNTSSQRLAASGNDFPFEEEEYWYLSQAQTKNEPSDGGSSYYGLSYFGRLSYNFSSKYLFYFTMRADGSSKYQEKWGYFPAVGLGWVLSEESFMKSVQPISFLKLRGGWGQLGNDKVPANDGFASTEPSRPIFGGQRVEGTRAQNYYSSLKWEVVEEFNTGLSSRFLKNRLSFEADWFNRQTKNVVVDVPIPLSVRNLAQNVGILENTGWEFSMEWSDKIGDMTYSVNGNLSTLKNRVTDLGGIPYIYHGDDKISRVGDPFRAFYGHEVIGVYQNQQEIDNDPTAVKEGNIEPGDFKYKDQNGDGVIDGDDRIILGSHIPTLTYGFGFSVGYKGIELSVTTQGQAGHAIQNEKRAWADRRPAVNVDQDLALNRWHGENTTNKYPSAAGIRKGWNNRTNSFFIESASYFRIQNIQLAYTIQQNTFMNHFPKTRFYVTADRPYTYFTYNGFSPEVAGGIDENTYPLSTIITLGVKITF